MKELIKDMLLRPSLWMVAVLLTAGVSVGAYVVQGGAMFSPGELSEQSRKKMPLGGVTAHAGLSNNCAACHAPPLAGGTMADRCLECHANVRDQISTSGPMHGRMADGLQCRTCHTEHRGAHAQLTSFLDFQHDWTAFKLTGHHRMAECSACHKNEQYQGTPQSCVACHAEPAVHKGRFGNNCQQCHSTATWSLSNNTGVKLAGFDHDSTGFKLTGKHAAIDCRKCHVNDTFKNTPKSCASCHTVAPVHKGRFSVNCNECHSTQTWVLATDHGQSLANFDHDACAFKLTGEHAAIDCRKCHVGDTFKGTAKSCVACHSEPKVHKGRFGAACADCHTTSSWTGALFGHAVFPINHRSAKNSCATCHNEPNVFTSYTCYNCHAHTPANMEVRHRGRKIANLAKCADCHGHDKRRRVADATPAHDVFCTQVAGAACPADAGHAPASKFDRTLLNGLKAFAATARKADVNADNRMLVTSPANAERPLHSMLPWAPIQLTILPLPWKNEADNAKGSSKNNLPISVGL